MLMDPTLFKSSQRAFQGYPIPLYARLLYSEDRDIEKIEEQLDYSRRTKIFVVKEEKAQGNGGCPTKKMNRRAKKKAPTKEKAKKKGKKN